MTDTPAATPAGWYPDAATPGLIRWWDGAAWSEHTAPAGGAGVARPLLPADRPIYSPFIWVIVLLPLISYLSLLAWNPDISSFANVRGGTEVNPLALYTPGYFVILGLGWVLYGLTVFLSYRDSVWLKRAGVVRPFHWAWSFFGGVVYVIGRSVIVRRVAAPRGLTPIWVAIGVYVIGLIVSTVWSIALVTTMMTEIRTGFGG